MPSGESSGPGRGVEGRSLPAVVARVFGDLRLSLDGELVALSWPAEGMVWSIEEPGILRCWDVANGRQFYRLDITHDDLAWAISPDARLLASANDGLTLWDALSGHLLRSIPRVGWVTALGFRGDGRMLFAGTEDGRLVLVDVSEVNQYTLRRTQIVSVARRSLIAGAFSPDGKLLALACEDRSIYLWDTAQSKVVGTLQGHTTHMSGLQWSGTGRELFSAGWDSNVYAWDVGRKCISFLYNGHTDPVLALAITADGEWLASADRGGQICIWCVREKRLHSRCKGHVAPVTRLAFSQDGRQLVSGGEDRRLIVWDVLSGQRHGPAVEHLGEAKGLALRQNGRRLVVARVEGIQVWDTHRAELVFRRMHPGLSCCAFSGDGKWIATGDQCGVVRLWTSLATRPRAEWQAHKTAVSAVAFSPYGKMLASAGGTDGYVYVWSTESRKPALLMPEATEGSCIEALVFHPSQPWVIATGVHWLASQGNDGSTVVWDVVERRLVARLPTGGRRLAVRPDGKQLALATLNASVLLWNLETFDQDGEVCGHGEPVTGLAYTRRGDVLVTGSEDGTLRLWHAGSGELLAGHYLGTPIRDLTVASDPHTIYVANANLCCYEVDLRLWDGWDSLPDDLHY